MDDRLPKLCCLSYSFEMREDRHVSLSRRDLDSLSLNFNGSDGDSNHRSYSAGGEWHELPAGGKLRNRHLDHSYRGNPYI